MLRKRIKKKKPLLLITKQKLHSKSTYFYLNWTPFCKKVSNRQKHLVRFCSEKRDFPSKTNNYMNLEHNGYLSTYVLPAVCITALLLVMGCMINPFAQGGEEVYAEEGITEQADTTGMSVALTMANPDQTLLQQNAKAGEMSYISSGFTVKTENVDGYNVYVQTAPGSTNKLTNGNISIDFVTTETPVSNFTDNTWGYAVDDTGTTVENLKYNPVPDTASIMNPAYTSSSTGETRNFTLNFATKFAKDATPGHYTSGVLLSVAAGASEVAKIGLLDIEYMQEMTTEICTSSKENDTKRLYDMRDGNKYWVTKLKDGNCWMTQNLAYDAPGATHPSLSAWGKDDTASTIYNPGSYIYSTPTEQKTCTTSSADGLESCASGWIDVNGWTASNDPNYSNVFDEANKVYDAHYLVGFYYSWLAATAGSGAGISKGDANRSICPQNWQLPTANNDGNKTFTKLIAAYGEQNGLTVGTYDIRLAPLYFVPGGYIRSVSGSTALRDAGQTGRYWLSTAFNSDWAYYFAFINNISTSGDYRHAGQSVRCVAR